ncbi:Hypothetical predicted protein [Paramuricea clavata]|uniref:Uncharacterized protein n=1 Tax=Paramuricea clavata TaxID=317549 RepID=A0A7D9ELF4_PARCT|nr:Hypothetical predicted protein [Paramuricea clavata]
MPWTQFCNAYFDYLTRNVELKLMFTVHQYNSPLTSSASTSSASTRSASTSSTSTSSNPNVGNSSTRNSGKSSKSAVKSFSEYKKLKGSEWFNKLKSKKTKKQKKCNYDLKKNEDFDHESETEDEFLEPAEKKSKSQVEQDEIIARELQSEFNNECNDTINIAYENEDACQLLQSERGIGATG